MAKLLAFEWDEREARVAVATPHGSEVVVEEAFAIDISAVASRRRHGRLAARWVSGLPRPWPSAV